jgi:hypothetical protein
MVEEAVKNIIMIATKRGMIIQQAWKREKDILSSRLNNLEHCTLITFKASPWDWVGEKHSLVGLHVQEMCLLQAIYLRTCYGVFKEEAKQEMKTFIWEFLANPNPNLIQ